MTFAIYMGVSASVALVGVMIAVTSACIFQMNLEARHAGVKF